MVRDSIEVLCVFPTLKYAKFELKPEVKEKVESNERIQYDCCVVSNETKIDPIGA